MVRVQLADDLGPYVLATPGPADHIGQAIAATGRPYEHVLLAILEDLLAPNDLVVDVGANIGNHTVAFARHGARVHAVEVNPEAADLLAENVEVNRLTEQVTIHRVGLSDRSARGAVHLAIQDNLGSAIVVPAEDGPVRLVPFADLGVQGRLRLVKVDVEGAEIQVLRGCLDRLRQDLPLVVIELHTAALRREARSLLGPVGYRMIPVGLAVSPTFLFFTRRGDLARVVRNPRFWWQVPWRVASRLRGLVRRVAHRAG